MGRERERSFKKYEREQKKTKIGHCVFAMLFIPPGMTLDPLFNL